MAGRGSIVLVLESIPWCKKSREPEEGSVSPPVRGELLIQEKSHLRLKTSYRKIFLCSVKSWNPPTMFFSLQSCRGLMKYLLPESLSFGAGWSCQLTCPLVRLDALAVSQGQFGEPYWGPLVWCLSQRRASLEYVFSRKTVPSRRSLGNEKVIVEHKEGLLIFLHCFFMVNHSLGDTQQYKVLNHGVGRNLRVHDPPPPFTEKPPEANPIL